MLAAGVGGWGGIRPESLGTPSVHRSTHASHSCQSIPRLWLQVHKWSPMGSIPKAHHAAVGHTYTTITTLLGQPPDIEEGRTDEPIPQPWCVGPYPTREPIFQFQGSQARGDSNIGFDSQQNLPGFTLQFDGSAQRRWSSPLNIGNTSTSTGRTLSP